MQKVNVYIIFDKLYLKYLFPCIDFYSNNIFNVITGKQI